jgi:hypothetical protein
MYKEKYIKYKTKYLELKNQIGGDSNIIQKGGWPWSNKKFELDEPDKIINITRKNTDIAIEINNAFLSTESDVNSKNTHLTIKIDSILDTEFNALIEGLNINTTIKHLNLIINELLPVKYTQLGTAISNNKGLMSLTISILDTNSKPIVVPSILIQALTENSELSSILFINIFNDGAADELIKLLNTNKNIKFVGFLSSDISEDTNERIKLTAKTRNKTILLDYDEIEAAYATYK